MEFLGSVMDVQLQGKLFGISLRLSSGLSANL